MFDSLQEGIVVLSDGKIDFMNDFSNKFTSFLAGLQDFKTNMTEDLAESDIDPLTRKIFYLFENDKGKNNVKGYKSKKKSTKSSKSSETNSIQKSSKSTEV
jgi:hypothetical protein